ncbi:hypothetical protein [Corynebacterium freiburgense]|uniref:hypothetical protein n=1 Tax=Corynebacterium freiburgense TaxID=556548 RepID=UPI00042618BF|nr:hypothetical protein [Corynebacterium freiburgense]WJZ03539.1 hypothetical protein CFREI_11355 [Corynebacterium freiburgense]
MINIASNYGRDAVLKSRRHAVTEHDYVTQSQGYATTTERLRNTERLLNDRIRNLRESNRPLDPDSALLFFDLDLSAEEYQWLIDLVKTAVNEPVSQPYDHLAEISGRYPLVFLGSLVAVAQSSTKQEFWTEYAKCIDTTNTATFDETGFYDLVGLYNLEQQVTAKNLAIVSQLPNAGDNTRNAHTFYLHAGIPGHELAELSAKIHSEITSTNDSESYAQAVFESLGTTTTELKLPALKTLALDFPEHALHLLTRIHELHVYSLADKNSLDEETFEGTNGLPEPTFQLLCKLLGNCEPDEIASEQELEWDTESFIIPCLQGANGLPVFSSSPRIRIPEGKAIWELRYYQVAPENDRKLLSTDIIEDNFKGTFFKLLQGSEDGTDPWVGTFEVEVFRNHTQMQTFTFNIAEGLKVSIEYDKSTINGNFIVPISDTGSAAFTKANITFEVEDGYSLRVPSNTWKIDSPQSETFTVVEHATNAKSSSLKCIVRPSRLTFSLPILGEDKPLRNNAIAVPSNKLAHNQDLEIHFPEEVFDVKILMVKIGTQKLKNAEHQSIVLTRVEGENSWHCAVSEILEHISSNVSYQIVAEWFTCTEEDFVQNRLSRQQKRQYKKTKKDPRPVAHAELAKVLKTN